MQHENRPTTGLLPDKYGLFNCELGTAADYELMLRFLLKNRIRCAYIPEVLVCMRVGGARVNGSGFASRYLYLGSQWGQASKLTG